MPPRFFANTHELRTWFRKNHRRLEEQWVGYYKKGTGLPSVTWPESVDVALCFGWIDGIRKRIDDQTYMVRFTPRRANSSWSARNLARMDALISAGLVEEAGLTAFRTRPPEDPERASLAGNEAAFPAGYRERIRANPDAWSYFVASRPSYRKLATEWILRAKREATRLRRLDVLVESCARGQLIPPLRWTKGATSESREE